MTRAPQLAPSSLPRRQRRRINSELYKLLHRDTCSICGSPHKHNSRTKSGLDAHGNVVVAGECCTDQVAVPFGMGQYVTRHYDFLSPRKSKSNTQPTNEQITKAIAAYQQAVAATDKQIDAIERRGGVRHAGPISLLDTSWKRDDRDWFKQNPTRSHRMRAAFPGELDGVEIPAGRMVVVLVRQVETGARLRAVLDPDVILLPGSPRDEAFAHAMFEVAVGHDPVPSDPQTLDALIAKYAVCKEPGQ